jgi:hypothetical protein
VKSWARIFAFLAAVGVIAEAQAGGEPDPIDVGIGDLRLGDQGATEGFLPREGCQLDEIDAINRGAAYASANEREFITLIVFPGSACTRIDRIRVSSSRPPGRIRAADVREIRTARGVRIGLTVGAVIGLVGVPDTEVVSGSQRTLRYRVDDPAHPLLKVSNAPVYTAEYRFAAGALVEFEFGFEYP